MDQPGRRNSSACRHVSLRQNDLTTLGYRPRQGGINSKSVVSRPGQGSSRSRVATTRLLVWLNAAAGQVARHEETLLESAAGFTEREHCEKWSLVSQHSGGPRRFRIGVFLSLIGSEVQLKVGEQSATKRGAVRKLTPMREGRSVSRRKVGLRCRPQREW